MVVSENAVIHTMDAKNPKAQVLVVRGAEIVAVGGLDLIEKHRGARRVDLKGACVVPGLIDAHGHLAGLGALQRQLDLRDTRSFAEMLQRIQARTRETPKGAWILGGRWDNATWGQKALPRHADVSKITPDHPVLLSRVDGHAALANAKALALAHITRETKDPDGGEILRDDKGEPTGILVDNAIALVRRVIPEGGGAPIEELWAVGEQACLRAGLTSVHDAGIAPADVARLPGKLKLRVYAMLSAVPGIERYVAENKPTASVRAVKAYIDGAMGSRGAWMLEAYADRPGHIGLAVTPPARLRALAEACARNGWQLCTHAIGDRGNREVLDAYESALKKHPGRDHRFRVEHAQCIALEDIPRFGALGVIASMQPTHATSDMRWAQDRVGAARLKGCYAWRRLLQSGARVAFGSDFPVESENPLWGFYAAVTRQDHEGLPKGGWLPDQRVSRQEALRLFTLDAAYAAFQEKELGSLEPGKLADFVVLDRDIMSVPSRELLRTRVLRTVIGGETVFTHR